MTAEYVDRETGQIPVAIGTSLALEGLLEIHPDKPKRPPGANRIREVWLNARTLIRNHFASMKSDDAKKQKAQDAVDILVEDFQQITDVLRDHNPSYRVVFYYDDLRKIQWQYPQARLKEPKTESQLYYQTFEKAILSGLIQLADKGYLNLTMVELTPPVRDSTVALLTHHPHELMWRNRFAGLFLLESHTGKLKSASQWFTKLKYVTEEDQIPFNKYTLQFFGDGSLFEGYPKKIRDEIKQLAVTRKWTLVVGESRVADDILRYGGQQLRGIIREMMAGK